MQGTRLGTYVLEDKIGEGGMGVVYTATDTRLKRKAVIKMLHKHLADHREIAKRFQNEAIAAAGIGHPGIVEIYDTGYADDGSLYIVMELLRGQSLQDRLDQAKVIEIDRAIAIIRQCASALSAAHENGIIHRDLKPDNVFLEVDAAVIGGERAKLLDFGIAKLAGANAASMLTATGMTMGTAYYMSPEQCKDAGGVDHRTDLYALGCILFQLLTGRFVFSGTSNNQLIIAHTVEPPPRVRSLNPDISPALEEIVSTLLEKEPDKRFANAEALITALDGLSARDAGTSSSAAQLGANEGTGEGSNGDVGTRPARKPENAHLAATNVVSARPSTTDGIAKGLPVSVGSGERAADTSRFIAAALGILLLGGAAGYWFLGNDDGSAVANSVQDAANRVHDATDSIRVAAEEGNANAQFELGFRYDVEEDKVEAIKWYRKAAEQGYVNAQLNLGSMYAKGEGVKIDHIEALKWYRKSAEQGSANGQVGLGFMYQYGNGVEEDHIEAIKWYRKAAEQGSPSAQFNLGKMYDKGLGVTEDDAEAINWYRKGAEQGDPDAQFELAIGYASGKGVTEDLAEAIKWYRMSAAQGSAEAQFNLGKVYDDGLGVAEDDAEAVNWYRKAAKQGDADAQANLGIMYDEGTGVIEDDALAVKWYRKSAEQGNTNAQVRLGIMYDEGIGVTEDDALAVKWYRKSAEQGNTIAQARLGFMYYKGNGITKDEAKAIKWYRKSAEQGNANAQANVDILLKD